MIRYHYIVRKSDWLLKLHYFYLLREWAKYQEEYKEYITGGFLLTKKTTKFSFWSTPDQIISIMKEIGLPIGSLSTNGLNIVVDNNGLPQLKGGL